MLFIFLFLSLSSPAPLRPGDAPRSNATPTGQHRRTAVCASVGTGARRRLHRHHRRLVLALCIADRARACAKVDPLRRGRLGHAQRTNGWPADGRWYGNARGDRRRVGTRREKDIPQSKPPCATTPTPRRHYSIWRARTATASAAVLRAAGIGRELLPNAVGRDFRPAYAGLTDSHRRRGELRLRRHCGRAEGVESTCSGWSPGSICAIRR